MTKKKEDHFHDLIGRFDPWKKNISSDLDSMKTYENYEKNKTIGFFVLEVDRKFC